MYLHCITLRSVKMGNNKSESSEFSAIEAQSSDRKIANLHKCSHHRDYVYYYYVRINAYHSLFMYSGQIYDFK